MENVVTATTVLMFKNRLALIAGGRGGHMHVIHLPGGMI